MNRSGKFKKISIENSKDFILSFSNISIPFEATYIRFQWCIVYNQDQFRQGKTFSYFSSFSIIVIIYYELDETTGAAKTENIVSMKEGKATWNNDDKYFEDFNFPLFPIIMPLIYRFFFRTMRVYVNLRSQQICCLIKYDKR